MRFTFIVPVHGRDFFYELLSYGDLQVIDHYGVIYLVIRKIHDHRYELAGFVYQSRHLIYPCYYSTKSKLYSAIQELLQEKL